MSQDVTLQAALTGFLSGSEEGRRIEVIIPSGAVLTIVDAMDTDQVAEALAIISPAALAANRTQVDRVVSAPSGLPGMAAASDVQVRYGAHGERILYDLAASSSVSSSTSSSVSSSASSSAS